MNNFKIILIFFILFSHCACGQQANENATKNSKVSKEKSINYSEYTQSFMQVKAAKIALLNAQIIDGTGVAPQKSQAILIEGNKIIAIQSQESLNIPKDFYKIDLTGKTVIPGIIGTHNHMRLPQGAMLFTSPKLYLACGVTTIQTCGTGNPTEEIEIAKAIQRGQIPGPEIINSSPYFTGPRGRPHFVRFRNEKTIRDTIRYWTDKGVKWFKTYQHTRPQDLKVIIDEAHKHQAKVTGHLCATTFQEAAELGIDAIEHGFIHSFDHSPDHETGLCSGSRDFRSNLDMQSEEVKKVQQSLIKNGVTLSSTLAIFEVQARGKADSRDLEALAPFHVEEYETRRQRMIEKGQDWYFKEAWLKKSMEYELAFYKAGGLLTAGPDPGLHNLPGYGDQKNYELFIEAGFKPEEAIQVMTANGAKSLERDNIGKVQVGMLANLVVLNGDLSQNPKIIRDVELVFKEGKAYDPQKLIQEIKGHVGSEIDHNMHYLGQNPPREKPKVFAPNFISMPYQYEFGSIFSKDSKEFFYAISEADKSEMLYTKLENGVWTKPEVIISHEIYGFNDPMLSPDEQRLYFISDRPLEGKEGKKDYDIWYVERLENGWSKPISAGDQINTSKNEYYISFTKNGRMYFSSNIQADNSRTYDFDIYYADFKNGEFQKPQKLSENINTKNYEADVFVAPDESYLIFCATRKDGYGQGDLYISFKDQAGNWSKAKNMGPSINDKNHQLCPFVSADGKYFFYTSNKDIYWVDTQIFNQFK